MGQARAAALRKSGIKARVYYCISGLIAALYVAAYSLENAVISIRAFVYVVGYGSWFSSAGRDFVQQNALMAALICVCLMALFSSRYSLIKRPTYFPDLYGFAIFFLLIYYVFGLDLMVVQEWMDQEEIGPGHFILPFLILGGPVLAGLAFLYEQSMRFGKALPLIILLALTPLSYLHAVIWMFKIVVVPFLIFTLPVYYLAALEYMKEHPEYRKIFIFGRGGAARWGGLYSFIKYDFNDVIARRKSAKGPIYCGQTLWYDDIKLGGRHIGLDSDSMMLTVAMMGGGKSLYTAWNTLLMWEGGAFVLDPKGEHAQRTVSARASLTKAQSHVIDPWGEVPHLYNEACATFNPLEEIDLTSPNARDEIFQIVESCIMQEADENANSKHFMENAQKIMTGVIAHVLTEYPEEHHNLPTIYDIILTGAPDGVASDPKAFDLLVDRMAVNDAMGRAPMDAAKVLKEAGENERGGFITTLATGLSWVNTPVLRPILMRSSFKMKNIKLERQSVYLVIPFDHMKNHSRFLRTVVSMGLMSCREQAAHEYKTLFLLDEFPQLGTFKPIKEGLVTLRSRDIKIWMHLQNLGQLKERYGNWQDFMSSCDKQFFAVNDETTAEEISKILGEYVERWVEGRVGETKYVDKNRPLRSPSEVMEELKKGSKLQYVLPADGLPLRLKLVPFKKNFRKYGKVKGSRHG